MRNKKVTVKAVVATAVTTTAAVLDEAAERNGNPSNPKKGRSPSNRNKMESDPAYITILVLFPDIKAVILGVTRQASSNCAKHYTTIIFL
jgi:hypothetical protein